MPGTRNTAAGLRRRSERPHMPTAWKSAGAGESGAGGRSSGEGDLQPRMNTIQVYLRRGTLDEATAEKMKRLARNKLERAISDAAYANGSYADEMEQDALLTEATS